MNLEQPTMYLQALKMKLHEYWSAQGCSIMERMTWKKARAP